MTITTPALFGVSGQGNEFRLEIKFAIHPEAQIGKVRAVAHKYVGELLDELGKLAKAEAARLNPALAG